MPDPDFAALSAALGAVEVPPCRTPLREVIAAWWHPVDADGYVTSEEKAGAHAMADRVLEELARVARV